MAVVEQADIVANALVFGFTLVGVVLGGLYYRTSEASGGGRFPLVVLGGAIATGILYVFVRGRVRAPESPLVLGGLVVSTLAFAALLPWLAGREV